MMVQRNEGNLTSPVTPAESARAKDKSNSYAQLQLTVAMWEFQPIAMRTSGLFEKSWKSKFIYVISWYVIS